MIASPAHRALSLSARRILDRLEIELAKHGGQDNGRLASPYDHFVEFGLHRHAIRAAINELVALGFVEVTQQGRGGNANFRRATLYRLTYRHTDDGEPTHDWRQCRSPVEAEAITAVARGGKPARRPPGGAVN